MIRIIQDDLRGPEIAALLQSHLDEMHQFSPPGTVHALDLDRLRQPEITFFSAWVENNLAGCGALKQLDPTHGEIKSMRTAKSHLRQGVAAAILNHIITIARNRNYTRLSLETGSGPPFAPAINLYQRFNFQPCGPFANYPNSAFSRFFTLKLEPHAPG